jgi:flavin reductase (DIM6/NTAB) family NADH-FMN oxidoreductase RutF
MRCKTNDFIGVSGPRQTFLITLADKEKNETEVIAVDWATPLSVKPPLFGISLSRNKHSTDLIRSTGFFTVNIPSKDILNETYWAGTHTGRRYKDKIAETGLTVQSGEINDDAVSIQEAIASFECKVVNEIEVGNHLLFVGEVLSVTASDDLFDKEKSMWIPEKLRNIYRIAYDEFTVVNPGTLPLESKT